MNKPEARVIRGKQKPQVGFPVAASNMSLPNDYQETLLQLKQRIGTERLKAVMSANSAMTLLYWDIGQTILQRQDQQGWGAKVIDRLSGDLKQAFPEMNGFSPRNLKYMRAFAQEWPDREIVQRTVAQIPWRSNLALMDKLNNQETRLWYVQQTLANGWSKDMLSLQIDSRLHERQGKAANNFSLTLPRIDSDLATQVFKDPYLFDFLGTADTRKKREVELVLEGYRRPMGVAQWETDLN